MSRFPPPSPQGRRLLGVIADSIKRGEIREDRPWTFLTYSAALERLGVPKPAFRPGTRLQRHGLTELNDWTREFAEVPKVSALIVEKTTLRPNPRFAASHGIRTDGTAWLDWWKEQATLSIRFDWSPYIAGEETWAEGPLDIPGIVAEDREVVAPDARDLLRWFAAGQSEAEILRRHPELTAADIREGLKHAAERLGKLDARRAGPRGSTFAQRWKGKFTLPQPDPSDPRLTYLLERYLRHDR
jgi:hypothetical protein